MMSKVARKKPSGRERQRKRLESIFGSAKRVTELKADHRRFILGTAQEQVEQLIEAERDSLAEISLRPFVEHLPQEAESLTPLREEPTESRLAGVDAVIQDWKYRPLQGTDILTRSGSWVVSWPWDKGSDRAFTDTKPAGGFKASIVRSDAGKGELALGIGLGRQLPWGELYPATFDWLLGKGAGVSGALYQLISFPWGPLIRDTRVEVFVTLTAWRQSYGDPFWLNPARWTANVALGRATLSVAGYNPEQTNFPLFTRVFLNASRRSGASAVFSTREREFTISGATTLAAGAEFLALSLNVDLELLYAWAEDHDHPGFVMINFTSHFDDALAEFAIGAGPMHVSPPIVRFTPI